MGSLRTRRLRDRLIAELVLHDVKFYGTPGDPSGTPFSYQGRQYCVWNRKVRGGDIPAWDDGNAAPIHAQRTRRMQTIVRWLHAQP